MEAVESCIRDIQQKRRLGIGEIVAELGISRAALGRIRKGEVADPGFHVMAKLHKLAGRSVDALLGIAGPQEVQPAKPFDAHEFARAFLFEIGELARGAFVMQQREIVEEPAAPGVDEHLGEDIAARDSASAAQMIQSRQAAKDSVQAAKLRQAEKPAVRRRKTG